jgi:predicted metal-dependent hydrolase
MKTRKKSLGPGDPNQLSFFEDSPSPEKLPEPPPAARTKERHEKLPEPPPAARTKERKEFIIEHRRVKHARIIINRQLEVRVVVPRQFTRKQVRSLIAEKSDWIEKQLQRFEKIENARLKLAKNEVLYLGLIYRFRPCVDLGRRVTVDHESRIISSGGDLLHPALLEGWYRFQARRLIEQKTVALGREFGFKFGNITIRGQKARWGSCSNKQNLSFNWRLIMTPATIMDYVILHELVHTEIMNHSPAFWARLNSVYPQFRSAKTWLKTNSWLLD